MNQRSGRRVALVTGGRRGIGLAIAGYPPQVCDGLSKSEEGSGFVILLGTIGFLARSLVFILIGYFLIFAAWASRRPVSAAFCRSERYGNGLLLIAAAGLLASGLFGVSEARVGRAANLPASIVRIKMNKMNGEF